MAKTKGSKSAAPKQRLDSQKRGLSVRNFNWGCIYTGTKAQIVAAGLATEQDFPVPRDSSAKEVSPIQGHNVELLNEGNHYAVRVRFNALDHDKAIRRAVSACFEIDALAQALALLRRKVFAIPPRMLSDELLIPARAEGIES